MTERRKTENMQKFVAPLVAAILGSSPATFISFEMYQKVSERSLVNQTQLLETARWQARQEMETDDLKVGIRELDKEITTIKIQIAKSN